MNKPLSVEAARARHAEAEAALRITTDALAEAEEALKRSAASCPVSAGAHEKYAALFARKAALADLALRLQAEVKARQATVRDAEAFEASAPARAAAEEAAARRAAAEANPANAEAILAAYIRNRKQHDRMFMMPNTLIDDTLLDAGLSACVRHGGSDEPRFVVTDREAFAEIVECLWGEFAKGPYDAARVLIRYFGRAQVHRGHAPDVNVTAPSVRF